MRLLRFGLPFAVLVAAVVGFVPRLGGQVSLDQWAGDAATQASQAPPATAEQVARRSAESHPGVRLVGFQRAAHSSAVTVTLARDVHSFLDGLPGLRGWFHLTSTQNTMGG